MERNWKERAFLDEYMRQKARDQYLKDATKPKSNRLKTIGTVITFGSIGVITFNLIANFSEILGVQTSNIFDKTLMIPILLLLGLFVFLYKS